MPAAKQSDVRVFILYPFAHFCNGSFCIRRFRKDFVVEVGAKERGREKYCACRFRA